MTRLFLLLSSLLYTSVIAPAPSNGEGLIHIYHPRRDATWQDFVIKVVFVKLQKQQLGWSKEELSTFVSEQARSIEAELQANDIVTVENMALKPYYDIYEWHQFRQDDGKATDQKATDQNNPQEILLAFSIDARQSEWTLELVDKARKQIGKHFKKLPVPWSHKFFPLKDVAGKGYVESNGPSPSLKPAPVRDPTIRPGFAHVYHSSEQSEQRHIRIMFSDGEGGTNIYGNDFSNSPSIWQGLVTAWESLPNECANRYTRVKALFNYGDDSTDSHMGWTDALDLDCIAFTFEAFRARAQIISDVLRTQFGYNARTFSQENVFFSSRKDHSKPKQP